MEERLQLHKRPWQWKNYRRNNKTRKAPPTRRHKIIARLSVHSDYVNKLNRKKIVENEKHFSWLSCVGGYLRSMAMAMEKCVTLSKIRADSLAGCRNSHSDRETHSKDYSMSAANFPSSPSGARFSFYAIKTGHEVDEWSSFIFASIFMITHFIRPAATLMSADESF